MLLKNVSPVDTNTTKDASNAVSLDIFQLRHSEFGTELFLFLLKFNIVNRKKTVYIHSHVQQILGINKLQRTRQGIVLQKLLRP